MIIPNRWCGNRNAVLAGAIVAALLCVAGLAQGAEDRDRPVMRIPKMRVPPVLDGKIEEREWAGASAVTGFIPLNPPDQYPADMKRIVYLGYDDRNLYLALYYTAPAGMTITAQTKNMEDCDNENLILFGDHLEIQISTQTVLRDRATKTGFGMYKIIVNPYDVFSDWWHNCDTPGSEAGWSSAATMKSTITDSKLWQLEMAIPLIGTMKGIDGDLVRKADGLELIMQLVPTGSSGGYGFGCWRHGLFYEWDKFYKVILDPQAPVMQFFDTSALNRGDLDLNLRLRGTDGQPARVSVAVFDTRNQPVFEDTKTLTLTAGTWTAAAFAKPGLEVPAFDDALGFAAVHSVGKEGRNRLVFRVEAEGKTVYLADLPFVKHTPKFKDATYGDLVRNLPKGDWVSRIAYIRRNGKFRVTVNTDVLGNFPPAIREARECRVRVREEGQDKVLLERKLPLVKGMGTELYDLGKRIGRFEAVLELLNAAGEALVARTHRFANQGPYEWENNRIGKERVVIPPWRPIVIADNTLTTRTAKVTVGEGGLWEALEVLGKPLLTGPMRVVGAAGGTEFGWQGEAVAIAGGKGRAFPPEFDQYDYQVECPKLPFAQLPETDGYEAIVTGKGTAGPISVALKSVMDFDGSTRHFLTYGPRDGQPVKVDRLELVCELFGTVNGLSIMREIVPSLLSLPTDRQGLLWESRNMALRPMNFRGTFVPYLRLGDGTYSLLFFAKSDQGWLLNDQVSCMRIERQGDKVLLRLLLVNAPATLDRPRTVDFVLTPMPSRTYPQASRHLVWGGEGRDYLSVATGWRKFGTGADNWYLPTDEEYAELYNILARGGSAFGMPGVNTQLLGKVPLQIYSSVVAVGSPLPNCDSFKGQWYKDSEYDPGKGHALQWGGKGKSPTGHPYDRPECFSEARPTGGWDDDVNDNYLWFYRKLATLSRANGINHWDNGCIRYHLNLDAGTYGYVRDDGHQQPESTAYQRWDLLKRNYVMQWLEGRPPHHNEQTYSYHHINRYCEGPWYVYTEDGTLFENFGDLAGFRMSNLSSNTPSLVLPSIWHRKGMSDLSVQRSYLALCILHDYGLIGLDTNKSRLLKQIDDEIGFLDLEQQAEFIPYWETDKQLRFVAWKNFGTAQATWTDDRPAGVYVSIFRSRTQPGKAMLWFVNAGEKRVTCGLRLDTQALVGVPRKDAILRNLEDGVQVGKELSPNVKDVTDRETLWGLIALPPRDFRAVIVEKGKYAFDHRPWP